MKCLFIYNPNSGRGKVLKKLDYIKKELFATFLTVDIFASTSKETLQEKVKTEASLYDVLVFSGGDGTFNDVVSAISSLDVRPILGYIPTGTANDIARNLKISRRIRKALKIIRNNCYIEHDVGLINNLYFFYVVGFGTCTEISYTTDQAAKKALGRIAYFKDGVKNFFKDDVIDIRLKLNDMTYSFKTPLFLVLNTMSVGGISFNKHGHQNNGKFEVCAVKDGKAKGKFNVLKFFIRGILGFRKKKFAYYFISDYLEIFVDDTVTWCIDGEKGPTGNVIIQNIHNHLKILVNPKFKKRSKLYGQK